MTATDIKSICRPQQPFLGQSNESPLIEYRVSTRKTTREVTTTVITVCKWGSFSKITFTMTEECILTGSGPWLIPMVLLGRMAKHDSSNAIEASLRANSLSQSTSFHLSLSIAIITGDYRQISYPVITTLVSLLGYNSAILYPSYFPLLLSGPSISNPPTSNSFTNYLIIPLDPTGRGNQSCRPKQSYIILIQSYPIAADMDPTSFTNSFTNYLITPLVPSLPPGRGSQFRHPKQSYIILIQSHPIAADMDPTLVLLPQYKVRSYCIQSIQLYSSGSWPQGAPLQQGRG